VIVNLTRKLCHGVLHFLGLIDYVTIGGDRAYLFYERAVYRHAHEAVDGLESHLEQSVRYLPLDTLSVCDFSRGFWTEQIDRVEHMTFHYHFLQFKMTELMGLCEHRVARNETSCYIDSLSLGGPHTFAYGARDTRAYRDDQTYLYKVDNRMFIFNIYLRRVWDGLRLSEQPESAENYSFSVIPFNHRSSMTHTRSSDDTTHIMSFYHPRGHFRIDFAHTGLFVVNLHYTSGRMLARMGIE
jgi:hypothetical protein